ncbi:MAG: hypothetical protein ACR2NM_10010, partial [Bythopirellula sp.]
SLSSPQNPNTPSTNLLRLRGVSTAMADSLSQLDPAQAPCTLAKPLAPEDVRVGDYVSPLHETYDFASFFWCSDGTLTDRSETVPIRFVAHNSGVPLRVKAVCLPFVLVKHPCRGTYTLDVRRHQLARLDGVYARQAWDALKSRNKRRKKKSK